MNRNMKLCDLFLLLAFLSLPAMVNAYELDTHARLTQAAVSRSVEMSSAQFYKNLGIYSVVINPPTGQFTANPFGETYYDVSGNEIRPRTRHAFEGDIIRDAGANHLSFPGWLMRGAIREDDLGELLGVNIGGDPHDDPYGNIFRVVHHFYDPVFDRPLTVLGTARGQRAPDWATGSYDAFAHLNSPDPTRRNHFTVFDAREALYRALTGKTRDGQDAGPGGVEAKDQHRKAYWATTFRALGDVVHLIQDMGQPQHTRNDTHLGPSIGHESTYEKYIDCLAVGCLIKYTNGPETPLPLLTYGNYPLPRFNNYGDFWSTRDGVTAGRGLADYSNRGFFSAGTNLGKNDYQYPSNNPGSYTLESTAIAGLIPSLPSVTMNFLTGAVPDTLNPDPRNDVRLTTESLWDLFLGSFRTYNLNRFNYNDMASLLVPRAVSYSAGFIDYFFRGKLEISPPTEEVYAIVDHKTVNKKDTDGFTRIKLKLKNITQPINGVPQDMVGGQLLAVAKFRRNVCYQPDLSGEFDLRTDLTWNGDCSQDTYRTEEEEILVSEPKTNVSLSSDPSALPTAFTFTFTKPIPINATDLYLQVVYRGPLGTEYDAVVVATKDTYEPTFFSYYNGTDYTMINDEYYTWQEIKEDPVLYGIVTANNQIFSSVLPEVLTDFQLGFSVSSKVVFIPNLYPTTYIRIAYLTDRAKSSIYLNAVGKTVINDGIREYIVNEKIYEAPSKVNQKTGQIDTISAVGKLRGTYYWSALYKYYAYSPQTPTSVAKLATLEPLIDPSAGFMPVTIDFPP